MIIYFAPPPPPIRHSRACPPNALQTYGEIDHGSADNPKTGYIYGKLVGITDGDTLKLLTENKKTVEIRLAEIDTPERRQPYGKRAKQELSDLAFHKLAAVRVVDIDYYQRTVGRIYVNDLDVSARWFAWVQHGCIGNMLRIKICIGLRMKQG